jgi:hypothetical protein
MTADCEAADETRLSPRRQHEGQTCAVRTRITCGNDNTRLASIQGFLESGGCDASLSSSDLIRMLATGELRVRDATEFSSFIPFLTNNMLSLCPMIRMKIRPQQRRAGP